MKTITVPVYRKCLQNPFFYCLATSAIVLWFDLVTGKHIYFPILYAFPVGLAAWSRRKILAYSLGILLPLARLSFHPEWDEAGSYYFLIINTVIRVMALLFYAYLIGLIVKQKDRLETKVKTLEGILPICASCKKIRDDAGNYVPFEQYITQHLKASFTHGLCAECLRKLYPDFPP